jgi:large subunit ribosomal protein L12
MEYMYGALLLNKLGKDVNAENLSAVVKAAGVDVDESKVKTLIASLSGVDIAAELANASAVSAAPAAAPEAKEEKKEEEKPVESAAGLASLFG